MIEARYKSSEHKDALGLTAELEAQGFKVDWSQPAYAAPVTVDYYDRLTDTWVFKQGQ